MEKRELIYEGKAKQVYASDKENLIIIHFKDDATAGNGAKKGTIVNKGAINNKITAKIFKMLGENSDKENLIIIHFKDDATAGNGAKKGTIVNKGAINNKITAKIFKMLGENGIKTHLVEVLNDRDQLCQKVKIFPLEVTVRNVITGTMSKRLGIEEGTVPPETIFEIGYKNDDLGDPLINDYHAYALGIKKVLKQYLKSDIKTMIWEIL